MITSDNLSIQIRNSTLVKTGPCIHLYTVNLLSIMISQENVFSNIKTNKKRISLSVKNIEEYLDAILNSDCVEFDVVQYAKDIIKTMLRALREGK